MQVHSITNSALSVLYAELKRKPEGVDTEGFLRESKPTLARTLILLLRLYPGASSEGFSDSYPQFCREIVYHWIEETDPSLFRSAHFGREVVLNAILNYDRDLHDIFRHAQLLGDYVPGGFVEDWWLRVSNLAQLRSFDEPTLNKAKLGRQGELIVFEHEQQLCSEIDGKPKPKLVSFEDNFKGWDITSFRGGAEEENKVYLEVKTTSNERTFFLTWREARMAKALGTAWQLVVVSRPGQTVRYYSSDCLLTIIPFPKKDGVKWDQCEIKFELLPDDQICLQYPIQSS